MTLTPEEILRYQRHLTLPEVGREGQEKLKQSSVLIVGLGGLGSPASLYLTAAGVGHLGLVEFDRVDASNLQRQILHGTSGIGQSKVFSGISRLRDMNPNVELSTFEQRITVNNVTEFVKKFDLVIDATDNFSTRYLIHDACLFLGKTYVYGSIYQFEGQLSVFGLRNGPCYRCLYPNPPPAHLQPNCSEAGVLGVLPGVIGTLQANEAIKSLLNIGNLASGRLILFDALQMKFRELKIQKDPECPLCGENPTIHSLSDMAGSCFQQDLAIVESIDPLSLKKKIDQGETPFILDVREPEEFEIANLGGKLIPLGKLANDFEQLNPEQEIFTLCHHGIRSQQAAQFLKQKGFSKVKNISGGIHLWALTADPSLRTY